MNHNEKHHHISVVHQRMVNIDRAVFLEIDLVDEDHGKFTSIAEVNGNGPSWTYDNIIEHYLRAGTLPTTPKPPTLRSCPAGASEISIEAPSDLCLYVFKLSNASNLRFGTRSAPISILAAYDDPSIWQIFSDCRMHGLDDNGEFYSITPFERTLSDGASYPVSSWASMLIDGTRLSEMKQIDDQQQETDGHSEHPLFGYFLNVYDQSTGEVPGAQTRGSHDHDQLISIQGHGGPHWPEDPSLIY